MKNRVRSLALPSPKGTPPTNGTTASVQSEGPVVIVGANGSGKTRLGTWIEFESEHKERVLRVSAQKSLAMPVSAPSAAVDRAHMELLYGYSDFDVNHPGLRLMSDGTAAGRGSPPPLY